MRIGELEPGEKFISPIGRRGEVVRQGVMGTLVLYRPFVYEDTKETAPQEEIMVSSNSEVTRG